MVNYKFHFDTLIHLCRAVQSAQPHSCRYKALHLLVKVDLLYKSVLKNAQMHNIDAYFLHFSFFIGFQFHRIDLVNGPLLNDIPAIVAKTDCLTILLEDLGAVHLFEQDSTL